MTRVVPHLRFVLSRQSVRRGGGFTLYELTIVVLIIGIIGLAILPRIAAAQSDAALRAASAMLSADIEFCESECISRPNLPTQIQFDVTNNQYYLARPNDATITDSRKCIPHPSDGQLYLNDFATGRSASMHGVVIQSAPSLLKFDAFGRPTVASVSIVLSNGHSSTTISVDSQTGDVSVK